MKYTTRTVKAGLVNLIRNIFPISTHEPDTSLFIFPFVCEWRIKFRVMFIKMLPQKLWTFKSLIGTLPILPFHLFTYFQPFPTTYTIHITISQSLFSDPNSKPLHRSLFWGEMAMPNAYHRPKSYLAL